MVTDFLVGDSGRKLMRIFYCHNFFFCGFGISPKILLLYPFYFCCPELRRNARVLMQSGSPNANRMGAEEFFRLGVCTQIQVPGSSRV